MPFCYSMQQTNSASKLLQQCVNEATLNTEMICQLLNNGANPFYKTANSDQKRAIDIALYNSTLWQLFVSQAKTQENLVLLFNVAVDHDCFANIQFLINQYRPFFEWVNLNDYPNLQLNAEKLLFKAALKGVPDLLRYLIRTKGIDANILDSENNTPLFYAAKSLNLEATTVLLQNNAQVNIYNNEGETPLLIALRSAPRTIIAQLIQYKADVNLENNKNGKSPLIKAAERRGTAIMQLLINNGANINARDDYDFTALMKAAKRGEGICTTLISFLLEHGANPTLKSHENKMAVAYAKTKEAKRLLANACEEFENPDLNSQEDI